MLTAGLTLALSALSCAGSRSAPVSGARIKPSSEPNSYYYYLVSQLKSLEQDEKSAELFLKQALDKDLESSFLWNQNAYQAAKSGDLPEALKSAQMSLTRDPYNVDSLLLMGKLAAVRQLPAEAISYYRRALALDPKSEEAYNLLARDYLMTGNKAAAVGALRQCLRELPETMSCLYYLGTIHLESGELDEALKAFTLITDYNPEQAKILGLMGDIYIKKQNYDEALRVFRLLRQINPDDLASQIRIGLLYYQLKETDKAIREFLKVSEKFPKADKVNYFLGLMLLEKLRFDEAYDYFDRVPKDSSFFKEALNRQLLILKEQDRLGEAAGLVDSRFDEKTPEYFQLKTSLLLLTGDYKDALQVLNQGLKKFENEEKLLFQRAIVHEKLGRWDLSREDLQRIIAINPNAGDAYNYLGYGMAERGEDLDAARQYVEKALELTPNEGHIVDSLGWVYFKMGRYDKALPLLHSAIRLEPEEPTILQHLGEIYFKLKDKRRSREYFEKSLRVLRGLKAVRDEELRQIQTIEERLAEF